MALSRLLLKNIRSIKSAEINPGRNFNLFYGDNGAGKTSLLEAINILSTGRSFRTHLIRDVIHHKQKYLTVSGTQGTVYKILQLGIERSKDEVKVRINQQSVRQISELSFALPVIEFHPGSTQILTGEPGQRRSYLDWGVFQTTPDFLTDWRQYQHVLKQRNVLLKEKKPVSEISLWDQQLISSAEKIHQARYQYLLSLECYLPQMLSELSIDYKLELGYRSGWKSGETFKQALEKNLKRDQSLGYTYSGPHRADLLIFLDSYSAASSASRGQLKFITILLKILQAIHYEKCTKNNAILLLDDLPSEFDTEHLKQIMQLIKRLNTQVFITTVNPGDNVIQQNLQKMFHVKQGVVREE